MICRIHRQTAIVQYHHYCLLPMAGLKITPPTHHSICGRWLGGTVASSPTKPATSARRDAGRVVSAPVLPLHSLSLAGLPKYDLSSGLAREADKSPLRTKFGRANSTALATHAPRLPHPICLPSIEQGRPPAARKGNEMENFHPRRHTPASARRRRRPSHTLMSLLTLVPFLAQQSRFGRLFSTIDNAVNAGLVSSSASTHHLLISLTLAPSLSYIFLSLTRVRVTFASTALCQTASETNNIIYHRLLQTCSTSNIRRSFDYSILYAD